MNPDITATLRSHFERFRNGERNPDTLRAALLDAAQTLVSPSQAPLRNLLEQSGSRIDLIVWGVCEAERDAHIADLLRELESKLPPAEP